MMGLCQRSFNKVSVLLYHLSRENAMALKEQGMAMSIP
jgi:hypothetical protein